MPVKMKTINASTCNNHQGELALMYKGRIKDKIYNGFPLFAKPQEIIKMTTISNDYKHAFGQQVYKSVIPF